MFLIVIHCTQHIMTHNDWIVSNTNEPQYMIHFHTSDVNEVITMTEITISITNYWSLLDFNVLITTYSILMNRQQVKTNNKYNNKFYRTYLFNKVLAYRMYRPVYSLLSIRFWTLGKKTMYLWGGTFLSTQIFSDK